MGTLGGLGGIVSHIVSLFGSKSKTPPPLSLFRLPDSQAQALSLGSNGNAGDANGAMYKTPPQQPSLQYHSAEIAQAVKQALLTSSSLNDVIAEL